MDQSEIQEDINPSQASSGAGDCFPGDESCYKILGQIGGGSSVNVYKAICLPMNSFPVAIKIIDLEKSSGDFNGAMSLLKLMVLSHPIILKPLRCFTAEGRRHWVVLPFMSGGSVQSMYASKFPGGLSEPCIATILRGLLFAMLYLHCEGLSHGDIKASNIFIDSDGLVKLGDFGFSASLIEPDLSRVSCGPAVGIPYWMAPEVIKSQTKNSFQADIWSFGVTALELAHARPPLVDHPRRRPLIRRLDKVHQFSEHFKDMVRLCLDKDPCKRPSADQLMHHPFFYKNCEGLDYLVKNVLRGLPDLEERFRELEISRNDEAGSSSDQNVSQRRISEWGLHRHTYELDPVFQETERVTSEDVGAVPVLHPNDDVVVPVVDSNSTSTPSSGASDMAVLMSSLVAMKAAFDMKDQLVRELISFTRNHEIATATREEEMQLEIDVLTAELESERQKRYDLEVELENLNFQLSNRE